MAERDPAAARFLALQLVRLSGVVLVVLGAMALAGTLALPPLAGAPLLLAGAVDFFLVPVLLARKWRTGGK